MVQRGPQVDDVALSPALRLEALENVGVQVHAEGAAATVGAMDWAGTAPLRSAAARQPGRQAEMVEDARQRQLLFQVREVDKRTGKSLRFA